MHVGAILTLIMKISSLTVKFIFLVRLSNITESAMQENLELLTGKGTDAKEHPCHRSTAAASVKKGKRCWKSFSKKGKP